MLMLDAATSLIGADAPVITSAGTITAHEHANQTINHLPSSRHVQREHEICATCICGRRAAVQGNSRIPKGQPGHGPGTIAWAEHELAWSTYAARYGRTQSAQRIHERAGFCYLELTDFLGRAPETWVPAGTIAERER